MAEEPKAKGSVVDSIFDSISDTLTHLLFPDEKHGHGKKKKSFFEKWFGIHAWVNWAGEHGISRGLFLSILYISMLITGSVLLPNYFTLVFSWLFMAFPVIGPIGFFAGFWSAWMWYIQSDYIYAKTKPILLEVKMPAEVTKSPRAMEMVLTSFWIRSGTTTDIDKKWHGGVLPYSSLEICSFGGEVHFYIWCRGGLRNVIESAMYAQYPEVEIVQVEDYATKFEYDPRKYSCFCTDYIYDPRSDVYPLKTYVDFELDKDPKEEFKVEPYANVLEVMSSLNRDEQAWIQIVIRGNFGKLTDKGSWQEAVKKEVDKIRTEASADFDDEGKKKMGFPRPTNAQQDQMRSMERNLSKLAFDVGMRGIYIAPAGKARGPEYTAVRWIWRPFNNPHYLNGIRPKRAHNDFDWLWQDWKGVRWNLWTRRYFDMYRRRQFFHTPWHIIEPPIRMSTEMIATLWHPPSRTIRAPGLQRIPVSKAEAPPNIPM